MTIILSFVFYYSCTCSRSNMTLMVFLHHWWYFYIVYLGGNSTEVFLLTKIDFYSVRLVFESEMAIHTASNLDLRQQIFHLLAMVDLLGILGNGGLIDESFDGVPTFLLSNIFAI